MLDPSAFFISQVSLDTPVPSGVVSSYEAVLSQATQAQPTWIPDLTGTADAVFSSGNAPRMAYTLPGATPAQQQVWQQIYAQIQPIEGSILQGALDQAQQQGEDLANNITFWDDVATIDTAIATVGASQAGNILKAVAPTLGGFAFWGLLAGGGFLAYLALRQQGRRLVTKLNSNPRRRRSRRR